MVAQNVFFAILPSHDRVGAEGCHNKEHRACSTMASARSRWRSRPVLMLGAEFVGVTQILVYGAVIVLLLFGVMLIMSIGDEENIKPCKNLTCSDWNTNVRRYVVFNH